MNNKPGFASVRLSNDLIEKLEEICRMTHRTKSQVVRLLIMQAPIPAGPDLVEAMSGRRSEAVRRQGSKKGAQ